MFHYASQNQITSFVSRSNYLLLYFLSLYISRWTIKDQCVSNRHLVSLPRWLL